VPPGCSIGCKVGLFSGADVGLFGVGTKKFQAGCNVGSLVGSLVEGDGEGLLVEGDGEGLLVVGRKIFPSGFIVGMFVVG